MPINVDQYRSLSINTDQWWINTDQSDLSFCLLIHIDPLLIPLIHYWSAIDLSIQLMSLIFYLCFHYFYLGPRSNVRHESAFQRSTSQLIMIQISTDHLRLIESIKTNSGSISDQYGSTRPLPFAIDPYWSVIDPYWSVLIGINRHWSYWWALIGHLICIDQLIHYWSYWCYWSHWSAKLWST